MTTPPDGRQPRRSHDRGGPSRPPGADPDDDARLRPGEQAAIDGAVVSLGRRGHGPALVAVLVLGAFILGLVRPWDLVGDGSPSPAVPVASDAGDGAPGAGASAPPDGSPGATARAAFVAPTCGYPAGWRTAAVQLWANLRARVWTAAEAVPATGPADPAIPFNPVISDVVEAIGWCAPVSGPERPPLAAQGTLFRIAPDGTAVIVPFDRLEPAAHDALGELWVPTEPSGGRRPAWPDGQYVIRLAAPDGTYARYLGLEVRVQPRGAGRSSPPEATASLEPVPGSPGGSGPSGEPGTAGPTPAP